MSCIQFFVCGIVSGIGMILFEEPRLGHIFAAWMPVLYAGVMSCGVGYTLQIVGQKGMNPTVASLILSLELSLIHICHSASSLFFASLSTIFLTISTYTFLIGSCLGIVIGMQPCFLKV